MRAGLLQQLRWDDDLDEDTPLQLNADALTPMSTDDEEDEDDKATVVDRTSYLVMSAAAAVPTSSAAEHLESVQQTLVMNKGEESEKEEQERLLIATLAITCDQAPPLPVKTGRGGSGQRDYLLPIATRVI